LFSTLIMRKALLVLTFFCYTTLACSQGVQQEYTDGIAKAATLFAKENYRASAQAYSDAFKTNGWMGTIPDRYNAACAWASAKIPDSAFSQLEKIALRGKFFDYHRLNNEASLKSLHSDNRWKTLISIIKENKNQLYPQLDLPLSEELDSVYDQDQKYRMQLSAAGALHGWDSKQVKDLSVLINRADSLNILKVSRILDERGWLGSEVAGSNGNFALFLVVQHASLKIQEKYLPFLQAAVKKGNAQPSNLALLTDRIAIRRGKKQIYGTQVQQSPDTFIYSISPLEDPDHVDERRAKMGLGPLAEYVLQWKIKWDVDEYKKSLEGLEEKK
jgi:hypothetical protein